MMTASHKQKDKYFQLIICHPNKTKENKNKPIQTNKNHAKTKTKTDKQTNKINSAQYVKSCVST